MKPTHRLSAPGPRARTRPNPARPTWRSGRRLVTGCAALVGLALTVPAVASAAPWGYLVSADGKQRLPLEGAKVVVGTGAKAGARLTGGTVAKRHATISHAKGVVRVTDLGSRTGTLVAGTPLKRGRSMQLFKATKLTFGAVTWTFEWGARGKLIQPLRKSTPKKGAKRAGRSSRSAKARAKRKARRKAR